MSNQKAIKQLYKDMVAKYEKYKEADKELYEYGDEFLDSRLVLKAAKAKAEWEEARDKVNAIRSSSNSK